MAEYYAQNELVKKQYEDALLHGTLRTSTSGWGDGWLVDSIEWTPRPHARGDGVTQRLAVHTDERMRTPARGSRSIRVRVRMHLHLHTPAPRYRFAHPLATSYAHGHAHGHAQTCT